MPFARRPPTAQAQVRSGVGELTDAFARLHTGSLRERQRVEMMRRVQLAAMDLFEDKGFDKVTIEDVAAAAEVSPSTIYRHFLTKEGLVLHDEHDDDLLAVVPGLLAEHNLYDAFDIALRAFGDEHFMAGDDLARRRTRLWFQVPSIRAAAGLMADDVADSLARLVADSPHHALSLPQARVVLGAFVGAVFTAIRVWEEGGATEDLRGLLLDTIGLLRDPSATHRS